MIIKKIKFVCLAALMIGCATPAYAVREGAYLGLQVGPTNTHAGNLGTATPTKSTGIGGRIFAGANLNPYAAIEMGLFTIFASSQYTVPGSNSSPQVKIRVVDFQGKGIFPFGTSGFSVFGKAGIAAVYSSYSGNLGKNSSVGKNSTTQAKPIIGVGVGYDITQTWVADFTFARIISKGSTGNMDLMSLGIAYHWVDKYCGQFLC